MTFQMFTRAQDLCTHDNVWNIVSEKIKDEKIQCGEILILFSELLSFT